jgi:anti-anti-sigma regulatory factor
MYHRIYRLAKRKLDPALIAATLKLPMDTIQNIIDRLSTARAGPHAHKSHAPAAEKPAETPEESFIDTVLVFKSHYAILDISGMLTAPNAAILTNKLNQIMFSNHKTLALRLLHVRDIDAQGAQALLDFQAAFHAKGRYAAILDPSAKIESKLMELGIDGKIPVFGTEIAFEENAFKSDHAMKK